MNIPQNWESQWSGGRAGAQVGDRWAEAGDRLGWEGRGHRPDLGEGSGGRSGEQVSGWRLGQSHLALAPVRIFRPLSASRLLPLSLSSPLIPHLSPFLGIVEWFFPAQPFDGGWDWGQSWGRGHNLQPGPEFAAVAEESLRY